MGVGFRAGLAIALIAGGATAVLPSASAQVDPAPRIDIFREPTSEAAPAAVTLPRSVVEAASAYETYLRNAAAIRANFRDGAAVSDAMIVAEAYQPGQLEEGMIAYAALIALEDDRFVRGVRDAIRDPRDGPRAADALLADPGAVAAIRGAGGAAALVGAVLREQGGQLLEAGRTVKQSAYDVQHQAWSKGDVPDPADRLAKAKALAASPFIPAADDVSRLLRSAVEFRGRRTPDEQRTDDFTPVIQRGLALAALAALGQADDEQRLGRLLSERGGADCVKMAKLNLYQCLAVAGPHYEDIFCMGQHAMMDTGQCVAAGGGGQPEPMASLPARNRDAVEVPIAENSLGR
jgi:hypothetical protein